jgi:hypothetical protein
MTLRWRFQFLVPSKSRCGKYPNLKLAASLPQVGYAQEVGYAQVTNASAEAGASWSYSSGDSSVGNSVSVSYPSVGASLPLNVSGFNAAASAAAMVSGGLDPTVSNSASISTVSSSPVFGNGEGAGAQAILTYSVEVVGGSGAGSVPIDVAGTYSATSLFYNGSFPFNNVYSTASLSVSGGVGSSFAFTSLFNVAPPGQNGTTPYQSGTVPFQSVIDFQLGQQYTVSMSAFSQAVCDGGLTNCYSDQAEGTAAFVDPTFTLDPSVLNPNQYTVLFNPNILLAAVPEPSTWAMLLLGFFSASRALASWPIAGSQSPH